MEPVNMQQSADPPFQGSLGLFPVCQFFFLMRNISIPEIADLLDHPWEFGIAEAGELLSDGCKDAPGRMFPLIAVGQTEGEKPQRHDAIPIDQCPFQIVCQTPQPIYVLLRKIPEVGFKVAVLLNQ